ncbi:hypothetical protein G5I_13487 [Acromyrmex echinatior]|uniref:Uncharacterized protein n=1 Tax=Acromyrmex echinatior TaxID=103372 RepID=F4X562_ACREC|nr:hypothetical protein G5I_13487 [Acromyrmex echinatior]
MGQLHISDNNHQNLKIVLYYLKTNTIERIVRLKFLWNIVEKNPYHFIHVLSHHNVNLTFTHASEHGARRPRLKSPGPSSPPGPGTPPLDPDLSFPHPLSACRRCLRPRVSICGQCTLLHEPRPFTEGPRNATALNNHPLEDRRPCGALERAQEAQENKVGIRIRQIAQRKRGGRIVVIQILFRDCWIHKSFESIPSVSRNHSANSIFPFRYRMYRGGSERGRERSTPDKGIRVGSGHSSPSRYSLAPPCISVSLTRTKRNALLGNSVVRRCGRIEVPGRARGIWEDKRMALGRFTAGWLLQIRQVRCFDAKERHRSLATWWRGGQWPPQTRFVEVSTRGERNTCLFFLDQYLARVRKRGPINHKVGGDMIQGRLRMK